MGSVGGQRQNHLGHVVLLILAVTEIPELIRFNALKIQGGHIKKDDVNFSLKSCSVAWRTAF